MKCKIRQILSHNIIKSSTTLCRCCTKRLKNGLEPFYWVKIQYNSFPKKGDGAILSYNQKKDVEKMPANQVDQEETVPNSEKSPEFDVFGTALNDLHSPFEF